VEAKLEHKTLSEDLKINSPEWTEIEDLSIEFRNDKIKNVLIIYNLIVEAE